MKFEKILLPFDGSVHSINATNYAIDIAKLSGAHVTIVHCYEWPGTFSEVPAAFIDDLKLNGKRISEEILKKARDLFAEQGVVYSLETVFGEAGYVLAQRAKSREYDLIIMGSHGHSDLAGIFLGSVTHKVLNTIYCPVLVVP